jgi:copper(I)-binding protein
MNTTQNPTQVQSTFYAAARSVLGLFLCSLGVLAPLASHAQTATKPAIEIKDAWARTTVPGQRATGAFMNITAKDGAKLVGASSPVAGVGEVHVMKMEGDVMRMRAIPALDLPAGQTVHLRPGSSHVMLMDLKTPLKKDSNIPLMLHFRDEKGLEYTIEIELMVSTQTPAAANSGSMQGHVQGGYKNTAVEHKH